MLIGDNTDINITYTRKVKKAWLKTLNLWTESDQTRTGRFGHIRKAQANGVGLKD